MHLIQHQIVVAGRVAVVGYAADRQHLGLRAGLDVVPFGATPLAVLQLSLCSSWRGAPWCRIRCSIARGIPLQSALPFCI